VGEFEKADLVVPSRALREASDGGRRKRLPPDPHGVGPPHGAFTSLVAAIRLRLPPRRFDGLAEFLRLATRCRSTGNSHRLGLPSRAHRNIPAGVLRGSGDPHGVWRPYSDFSTEVRSTRDSIPGTFRLQGFSPS
jgi:hypothetical protein